MAKGFLYRVVIMDWVSRAVLAWRLSNSLGADFCVAALEQALCQYGRPETFNTDQSLPQRRLGAASSPATISPIHPEAPRDHHQHGRQEPAPAKAGGRYMDNIFVERLWRRLKYEEVYRNAYASVAEAKAGYQ
jgi:putative transposase